MSNLAFGAAVDGYTWVSGGESVADIVARVSTRFYRTGEVETYTTGPLVRFSECWSMGTKSDVIAFNVRIRVQDKPRGRWYWAGFEIGRWAKTIETFGWRGE